MGKYVVMSQVNDECSCNNRIVDDHQTAWTYVRAVEKNSGCRMRVCHVQELDERDRQFITEYERKRM